MQMQFFLKVFLRLVGKALLYQPPPFYSSQQGLPPTSPPYTHIHPPTWRVMGNLLSTVDKLCQLLLALWVAIGSCGVRISCLFITLLWNLPGTVECFPYDGVVRLLGDRALKGQDILSVGQHRDNNEGFFETYSCPQGC